MSKKILSVLAVIALLCMSMTPFAAVAEEGALPLSPKTQEAVDAGLVNLDGTMPIITDPDAFEAKYGKLSALIVNSADRTVPVGELTMVQRWAEDTGVRFDWQAIPQDGSQENISLMLAGGAELPDVFWNFGDGRSTSTVITFLDQEVFMPTEELIYQYCPTLVKILEDNENYMMEVTAPDGHMYGFPYIEEMYGLVLTPGPLLINQEWLTKVGMEMPTTVDELTEVLRAFRDAEDLNGNGEDDEIPMATIFGATDTFGSYNLFYRFTGAFGCADSYCGGNRYADHMRLIDGKVTYTALDEAFGKTAMYFNQLYTEGLLNKDCFDVYSDTGTNYTNNECAQDIAKIGVLGLWSDMTLTNNDVRHEYVAIPQLQGEAGTTGVALNYSELQDACDTAITVDCEFPEIIAAFIEYLISDPALSVQSNWGAVGYNYYQDEDGVLRFNLDENGDIIPVEPYRSFGEMRSNTTTARGSMIVLNEYYDNVVEYTYDAVNLLEFQKINGKEKDLEQYDTIPKIMLTTDEQATVSRLYDPIADTVNRYITEWVLNGNVEETWDAYVAELQAAGVEQLVGIYQGAIDRINGAQ